MILQAAAGNLSLTERSRRRGPIFRPSLGSVV